MDHAPEAYGLHVPCKSHHVTEAGEISLELAGGQRVRARLEGLDWPERADPAQALRSYLAELLMAASELSAFLYSAMRGREVNFTAHAERYAGREVWPCRLYVDGTDVARYLHELRPELRAAA